MRSDDEQSNEEEAKKQRCSQPDLLQLPTISMSTVCTPSWLGANDTCHSGGQQLLALAKLSASKNKSQQREPITLMIVLDRSGSMEGPKLTLCLKTVSFVIDNLAATDRLGLVTFDTQVRTEWPMCAMDEEGKQASRFALASIRAGTSTNLSGGLMAGIEALRKGARNENEVKSVLLLTDGLANHGERQIEKLGAMVRSALDTSTTIFTFGYGQDHDEKMLRALSDCGKGVYYFVSELDTVPTAFADCLGGLLSVVAQNITLALAAAPGVLIQKIHTTRRTHVIVQGKQIEVDFGDMYAEEERDLLLELTLDPQASCSSDSDLVAMMGSALPVSTCSLRYVDIHNSSMCDDTEDIYLEPFEADAHMAEVADAQSVKGLADTEKADAVMAEPVVRLNRDIALTYARICAADAMDGAREQADQREYGQANETVMTAIGRIQKIASALRGENKVDSGSKRLLDHLLAQLQDCNTSVADPSAYQARGRYMMANYAQGHHQQRSNTSTVWDYDDTAPQYRSLSTHALCMRSQSVAAEFSGLIAGAGGAGAGAAAAAVAPKMGGRQNSMPPAPHDDDPFNFLLTSPGFNSLATSPGGTGTHSPAYSAPGFRSLGYSSAVPGIFQGNLAPPAHDNWGSTLHVSPPVAAGDDDTTHTCFRSLAGSGK
jgi:uncharacterized protein YegL